LDGKGWDWMPRGRVDGRRATSTTRRGRAKEVVRVRACEWLANRWVGRSATHPTQRLDLAVQVHVHVLQRACQRHRRLQRVGKGADT
jgi:hypothetical protein